MDPEQQFQAAAQLYQAGDLSGAEGHLDALAQTLPKNPNVLHLLSLVRLRLDKADAAAQSLKTLTDVAPGSAEAHELYGIALRQAGRVNGAIRQFNRALEITPDSASIHYNLGNAYRDDHQVEQAITHYSRAVELDPDNLNARFNLGQAFVSLQDWRRATGAFVALVDRAPHLGVRDGQGGARGHAQQREQHARGLRAERGGVAHHEGAVVLLAGRRRALGRLLVLPAARIIALDDVAQASVLGVDQRVGARLGDRGVHVGLA